MIDLHAPWLLGVDGVPASRDEVLRLAHDAVQDGITAVGMGAQTGGSRRPVARDEYFAAFERARQWLLDEGIDLGLVPSMEVRLAKGMAEGYRRGHYVPLGNTAYLCLELPPNDFPAYTFDEVQGLQDEGCRVLLLHPERNRTVCRHPELMARLSAMGVVGVASAGSLMGRFGEEVEARSWYLMDAGWIHTVASDVRGRQPLVRLSPARELLCRRYGDREAFRTMLDVPKAILQDRYVEPRARDPIGWQRWRMAPVGLR
ncbi:MAG: hypothetical protein OWU33_09855 [Firmicutes bacterium]|nr:hypothetical protein [Bacillota bacterium]